MMHTKLRPRRSTIGQLGIALLGVALALAGCEVAPPDNDTNGDTCKCERDLQVTIETRFVLVSDTFLDDVGVDFDSNFVLSSSTASPVRYPATPFVPGDGFTTASLLSGMTDPEAVTSLIDANAPPAVSGILGTVLSEVDLNQFLQAANNDAGTDVLQAPTITVVGDQNTFSFIYDEQFFQNDLQADFVSALQAIDPLINPLNTGPSLEIRARGVADRRFVVLELLPSVGGTFNTPDVTGERTVARTSNVSTRVSIPDGQTVVLGGLINNDQSQTEGVLPLFGRVPILGSAVRNRTTTTENSTLLILVKPTIIIQDEE